ncbi:MAG: serine/threonine-protein kinase [Rudaea sp.]
MQPEIWKRVSTLFETAMDIAADQRAAWLKNECVGEPDIERAVSKLLDADEAAHAQEFLETPIAAGVLDMLDDTTTPDVYAEGTRAFGPYRLLRLIGQGGMGEVHLAERADGVFEQRVALKLLPHPTPGMVQRFNQERQILARLEHSNIARLLDGGIGEHGIPYFAMEYVEGVPINEFVRDRALDVKATLRLFLDVCDAVQYAHRSLIVHRDLKPSNILVSGDGAPKLLDFGIAKLLLTTGEADASHTATRVFTPDYAAPEQIRGEPVTTATDVYSLGVVLYELLTGTKPYSLHRGVPIERAIVQIDATAPSAIARLDPRLRRELRGDVDRIVLTMIAKEPERRYGSVEALSNDIRRYLAGRPIAARGDHRGYRARKFIRRNRVAIAASFIVAIALLAATTISLWQAHRANLQAQRAETVKNFLVSVFDVLNPDESKGDVVTARTLLDQGAARVDRELASQPALQAELTGLIGKLYYDLGVVSRAEPLLRRAVDLSAHLDENTSLYLRALVDLSVVERKRGDYVQAVEHQNAALERASAMRDDTLAGDVRREMVETFRASGEFDKAESAVRVALAADRKEYSSNSAQVSHDLHDLGLVLDDLNRYEESEAAYKEALIIARNLFGEMNTSVASLLNDYGLAVQNRGDLELAEKLVRQSLDIHRKIEGADHPQTLETENNLAAILNDEGKYDETIETFTRVLESRRHILGPNDPGMAVSLNNLAIPEHAHGDFDLAEKHLREAISIWNASEGPEHPDTARGWRNLAAVLRSSEHFAGAEEAARKALAIDRAHYPETSEQVAAALNSLGRVQRLEGRFAESLASHRQALADLHAANRDDSSHAVWAIQGVGETLISKGDYANACLELNPGLILARKTYPEGNHEIADLLVPLGICEHALGHDDIAERVLREAMQIREKVYKPQDQHTAEVQVALAEALMGQHDTDAAKSLAAVAAKSLSQFHTRSAAELLARAKAVTSIK